MNKEERCLRIVMSILLILAMLVLARETAGVYALETMDKEKRTVVIDVGHGGIDPGKVGITGCLEKDINLQIAQKLKVFLEMEDMEVVLTRNEDIGLYKESDSNKKLSDMKERIRMIEGINPALMVSIHQNSYTEESVKGSQTFYYHSSEEGKKLAGVIQARLVSTLDKENHRQAKANDDYYILKHATCPAVIVECGFLSNQEECEKLMDSYYQEKVAWAIYMGIMQYLN